MVLPESSISSYHAPRGSTSGPKASADETGSSAPPAMRTVKRRPRRSTTRCSPCSLTIPPSSTPACWTLVTESAIASAAFAGAAEAGAGLWASMPCDAAKSRRRTSSLRRRSASSAQRLKRSASSCSLANAVSVFRGAVDGLAPAGAGIVVAASAARAAANSRVLDIARSFRSVGPGRKSPVSLPVNGGGDGMGLSDVPATVGCYRAARAGGARRAPSSRRYFGGVRLAVV